MAQPGQRLLDDAQHSRLYDLYMREARSPSDCVPILMAEFEGLKITPRQITNYVQQRKWSKRKKALLSKAERRASKLVEKMASSIAQQKLGLVDQHKAFLEKSATVGARVLEKASNLIEATGNARDLASAANAAAKGVEIYRKAVGLEDSKGGSLNAGGHTFNFNFARAPGSPFAAKVVDVRAEEVQEAGPEESSVSSSGSTHAPA